MENNKECKNICCEKTCSNGSAQNGVTPSSKNLSVKMSRKEALAQRKREKEKLQDESFPWPEFKQKLFDYLEKNDSADMVTCTKTAIEHLEEVIHPIRVHNVTVMGVQVVKEYLQEELCLDDHTISDVIRCIKNAMRLAHKWDMVLWQDWDSISAPEDPTVPFHTNEKIDKILNACPNSQWRALVLLGANAGLRREEIANLRWNEVDLPRCMLYVDMPQKKQIRTIPLTNALRRELMDVKERSTGKFVISEGRDTADNENYLTSQYQKISKKAGLRSNIRTLRNTFAHDLLQKGLQLNVLAKLMGNSIEMARKYAPFQKLRY